MRIKTRVKAAMAAQAATQGRYLGGRPPYGYRLVDIGPHPHPEKAALGAQLHQLAADPDTGPVVQRIFASYLAGRGYFAIAEALTADGVPSPSGHDRARNSHRLGAAWSKSAVRAILTNPRYTGHQVWGKQRRDEVLLDVDDVAAGHETVMRWNEEREWTWSIEPVHEPLVSRSRLRGRPGDHSLQHSPSRSTYPPGCGTPVRSTWPTHVRDLRTPDAGPPSSRSPLLPLPLRKRVRTLRQARPSAQRYLREDDLLPQIDEWLGDLFSPERIETTLDLLLDAVVDTQSAQLRARLEHELRHCDHTSPSIEPSSTTESIPPSSPGGSRRSPPPAR